MNHYTISQLEIGQKETFTVCISEEMQEAFMKLTGDVNPMHMEDAYAREKGFEGRLVYGMLTASFYSTLVGVYLPGEKCLFQECDVSWRKPVYIGDELIITGEVKEKDERWQRVTIKAHMVNQNGEKVSKATLVVGIR